MVSPNIAVIYQLASSQSKVYTTPSPSVAVQTQVSPTCSRACHPSIAAQTTPQLPPAMVIFTQYLSGQSAQSGGQLGLGDTEADGEIDGDTEGLTEGEALALALALGETEGEAEALGESEIDAEGDDDSDGEADALGDKEGDMDGETDAEGDTDGETLELGDPAATSSSTPISHVSPARVCRPHPPARRLAV